jgi:hypothetical protein
VKLKLEPLIIAAAIGAVIWIIGGMVTLIFGLQMFETMLDAPLWDPAYVETLETIDPNSTDPLTAVFGESFRNMFVLSSVANLLQCVTWLLSGAVAGALYIVLYRKSQPTAVGNEAGVGAAAGALAVVLGYLITSIISTIFMGPMINEMMSQVMTLNGAGSAPPAAFEQMASMMVVFVAVGAICGVIFYGAIGAVMGALGGFLGNSLAKPAD